MARLEFDIPDYTRGFPRHLSGGLEGRISLALAGAHVRAVEAEAKRRAPLRTGRLRNSIRAFLAGEGRGVLEATAPYAKYLHEGTGVYGPGGTPIFIEPRGKRALNWPGARHPVRVVRQKGIRPRDFLRHAVRMYFPALRAFAAGLRMKVLAIFARNYMKLREAGEYLLNENEERKQKNQEELEPGTLDKYFHCKANCEVAQLAYLAEAITISYVKEGWDLTADNWFFGGNHTLDDSMQNMVANLKVLGRGAMAPTTPCSESCIVYRPDWLPERFW